MRAVELVFAVGWAAFWLYWIVAAFSMKRVKGFKTRFMPLLGIRG